MTTATLDHFETHLKHPFVKPDPLTKWFGRKISYQPPTFAEYLIRQKPVYHALQNLQGLGFRVIDAAPLFCSSGICMVEKDGYALYVDDDHLSPKGAEIMLPLIREILAHGN